MPLICLAIYLSAPSHLGRVLRDAIAERQIKTRKPWKKIIVIVEGIYSMEGEICQLPEIVSICKKYKVKDLRQPRLSKYKKNLSKFGCVMSK